MSTLAEAAHLSGKELSDIQRPLVAFNEQLVKAQTNTATAATLTRAGVTEFKNMDVALDQLVKGFNSAASGQDKLHAAVEILGKKGGPDFINVMAKMKGGLIEAQKEAERMGETLSEEDVQAAKEFGVAFDTVGRQVEIGAAKFALAYAPQITDGLNSISESLAANKDTWAEWGHYIGAVIQLVEDSIAGWQYAFTAWAQAINQVLGTNIEGWNIWATVPLWRSQRRDFLSFLSGSSR